MTADLPISLIFFPTRTGKVSADNTFDRERFSPFDQDSSSLLSCGKRLEDLWHRLRIGRDYVVRDIGKERKPKISNGGEQRPFTRDRRRKNAIERRDTVACDDEELVVTESVNVTNFALAPKGEFRGETG